MLIVLVLMLAPQFIGATRLGRNANLQATLDATEDAVLREPAKGAAAAGPRVRATLVRAHGDVRALDDPALAR